MCPGLTLARCQLVTTATTTRASRVAAGSFCLHAVAITPAGLMELIRSYFSINVGLPQNHGGSAPALIVSRPAQRSLTVENPGLRYWDAGYGVQEFHPIAEHSQFSDHLARAVLP